MRHLADTYHLSKEAYLRKTPKNGKSRAQIAFKKTGASTDDLLPSGTDHILWYAKERANVKYHQLYKERSLGMEGTEEYQFVEEPERNHSLRLAGGTSWSCALVSGMSGVSTHYPNLKSSLLARDRGYTDFEGGDFSPGSRYWSTHHEGMKKCETAGRFIARKQELAYKRYLDDFPVMPLTTCGKIR